MSVSEFGVEGMLTHKQLLGTLAAFGQLTAMKHNYQCDLLKNSSAGLSGQ